MSPESARLENTLTLLAAGLDHPEGVAWDEVTGRLVFGTEGGRLQALDPESGEIEELACGGGFLLGVAVRADGSVLVCDMTHSCVWRWQPDGADLEPFFRHPDLRVPNFIVGRPDGGVWVSDSGSCWDAADGTIWLVADDGVAVRATSEVLAFPNGMALSNDGTVLFCLESYPPRLLAFAVTPSGVLGPSEEIVDLRGSVPDGLVVLPDDTLVIACYRPDQLLALHPADREVRVLVADPKGRLLAGPANACLFGRDVGRLAVSNVAGNHLTEVCGPLPGFRSEP